MKQYDAYIFDLYGTLIDIHTDETRPAFWRAMAAYFTAQGTVYTPSALRERYLSLCREENDRLCREQACTQDVVEIDLSPVFEALLSQVGGIPSQAQIADAAWEFRRRSTSHLRAYAGARALLYTLREQGRRVYLLSNAQALFTLPELELLGLSDCFDRIYISSDCGCRKPARRFMERLLGEQALTPDRCLMLGNDPNADVAVAQSVGMDSFYLRSGQSPHIDPHTVPATYVQPEMDLRRLQRTLLKT